MHIGERVQVSWRAPNAMYGPRIAGVVAAIDERGILVETEGGRAAFIPWANISAVTKSARGG
jgi:hypothetical protein